VRKPPDDQDRKPRKTRGRGRANGEGSIFPYKNGYAGYVWVTTPTGDRRRKWAYGKTREETHEKWLKLHEAAGKGPVATKYPTLAEYLQHWLTDVVQPDLAPLTAATYETLVRLYIVPTLGRKRLEKLSVADIRAWLNNCRETCQCCAQGKDVRRREGKRKCCAVGRCCQQLASERTCRDAWTILRAALGNAVRDELLPRNVASLLRVPKPRRRRVKPWTVEEARKFLEAARTWHDPMYAVYILVLSLGLRRGEALGVRWEDVDLDAGDIRIGWQLQRVSGRLLHRETKTDASDAVLPLVSICTTALRERQKEQDTAREKAGGERARLHHPYRAPGRAAQLQPKLCQSLCAGQCETGSRPRHP
jgi:integrase